MSAGEAALGCSALLRVAGLPVRYWLAGANPALFGRIERLERLEETRRTAAVGLADRIGDELVTKATLAREDRAFLLGVRRNLHRGASIAKLSRERFITLSALSDDDAELVEALVAMVDRDRAIAALSAEVEADVAQERERLLGLSDEVCHESRVAKALLAPQSREEPAPGAQLSRKSRRHRSDHQWQRIARAATGSTPRGWLSHVALVPIDARTSLSAPTVSDRFTAQWMENVRAPRLALRDPPSDWPAPDSRLAVNPLRWDAGEWLVCVVLDGAGDPAQVTVRHTPLLDAICSSLADAVHTFDALAEALGCTDQAEKLTLRGFVRHLVVLGILQPSAPPRVRLDRRATPGQTTAAPAVHEGDTAGWVDVYRLADTGISVNIARDVQRGVSQLLRLLSVMKESKPVMYPPAGSESERSWSLADIVREEWDRRVSNAAVANPWGPTSFPALPTSGFADLIRGMAEGAGDVGELVIDSQSLPETDAPGAGLSWPFDCLVRVPAPGAGFTAVLDELWPPGMLDARFLDTLVEMHGEVPHMEAYRAFLLELERLTGVLFVELLLPPLDDGAANAVRRPVYTSAWTGDPHTAAYLRGETDPAGYIPLRAIRIRRIESRLRAELDGRPVWPVYHATRSFSPLWDRVALTLLAAVPLDLPWNFKRMIRALTRVPGLRAVPRICLSDGVVLSPAQWQLSPDDLWDEDAPTTEKLRGLIRLRSRHALPRWVHLDRGADMPPIPCDLESVHAIRAIQRWAAGTTPLNVSEMLPAPGQFLVRDRAHASGDRLAAQLLLRFPYDEPATAMAARVAPAVLAALDAADVARST